MLFILFKFYYSESHECSVGSDRGEKRIDLYEQIELAAARFQRGWWLSGEKVVQKWSVLLFSGKTGVVRPTLSALYFSSKLSLGRDDFISGWNKPVVFFCSALYQADRSIWLKCGLRFARLSIQLKTSTKYTCFQSDRFDFPLESRFLSIVQEIWLFPRNCVASKTMSYHFWGPCNILNSTHLWVTQKWVKPCCKIPFGKMSPSHCKCNWHIRIGNCHFLLKARLAPSR